MMKKLPKILLAFSLATLGTGCDQNDQLTRRSPVWDSASDDVVVGSDSEGDSETEPSIDSEFSTETPQSSDTSSQDISSTDSGTAPQDTGSEPQDTGSEPEDTGSEPEDTDSEPEDTGSEPEDTGSEPEDTGSEPEDTGSEPEDTGSEPEDTGSEPEDTGSETQDTIPETESIDSDTQDNSETATQDTESSTQDSGTGWAQIPPGSFWMGTPGGSCPSDYPGGSTCGSESARSKDEVLHYVTVTYEFEMMQSEVTQSQFEALLGYNPSHFGPNGPGGECGGGCPVENVSWHEALAFANAMSQQDGLEPCFVCTGSESSVICHLNPAYDLPQDCEGYRLPTESEREYATRAGTLTAFHNGPLTNPYRSPLDPNLDEIAWYGGNSSSMTSDFACSGWFTGATTCGPQPRATKAPNPWGLYDMSGNVKEWTWDWYGTYPTGTAAEPIVDPSGPASGQKKVVRGGAWSGYAYDSRSGYRDVLSPNSRAYEVGLRLVRSIFH
jgi:formylglycine-generating enzyme required for sulfatase activity